MEQKPHIPQPRPTLPPMPTWMVWVFALAIPIDTLIIGWIVHLIQTGAA